MIAANPRSERASHALALAPEWVGPTAQLLGTEEQSLRLLPQAGSHEPVDPEWRDPLLTALHDRAEQSAGDEALRVVQEFIART
jgi:hypothetical protein